MNVRLFLPISLALTACSLFAQKGPVIDSGATIRTETRVVLVDSVVTDKKGNYVHDLTQKDFRVWEDNKEQTITSFALQSDNGTGPGAHPHDIVLFFDHTSTGFADEFYIKKAATEFIDSNAGEGKRIAIMDYFRTLRLAQNFTEDKDRLKEALKGIRFSGGTISSTAGRNEIEFNVRGVLVALRKAANGLANTPGRKTLVFLSGGFPVDSDTLAEVNATISACNRNNVAIYAIDVRGLVPGHASVFPGMGAGLNALLAMPLAFQAKGGGGPATGGSGTRGGISTSPAAPTTGGSTAPTRGTPVSPVGSSGSGAITRTPTGDASRGGTSNAAGNRAGSFGGYQQPLSQAQRNTDLRNRILIPENDISGPQQVLFMLASGTGGFVIANTNDMLGGLERIGKDQNEYYVVGYTPSGEPKPDACHSLKVKVDRGGTTIRARSGYCEARPLDVLSGTATERDLEAKAKANDTPSVTASLQASFFYTGPDTARIHMVIEVPGESVRFTKEKGLHQGVLNVIGTASLVGGGGVAARFSDSVKFEFADKRQVEEFRGKTYRYEKQFEIAPGDYALKAVFGTGGEQFGRLEKRIFVEPWKPETFMLSAIALARSAAPATGVAISSDAVLLEDQVPLVVNGVRLYPTGSNHFKKGEFCFVYAEIYEPDLIAPGMKEPPKIGVNLALLDEKATVVRKDFGASLLPTTAGIETIPVGLKVPIQEVPAGNYLVAITAGDAASRKMTRVIPIVIEE